MELVAGETLADRLARGPIPVEEALRIAQRIAEALEAAHEKGVIHRDLKPANVKVDAEGNAKVLDFSLAEAFSDEETPESELSQSPTLSRDATRAGVILGTAAYMSPEQAKGKAVDKRTDVFSFGIVLYAMLTGKRAFTGEDAPPRSWRGSSMRSPTTSSPGTTAPRSTPPRPSTPVRHQRLLYRITMKGEALPTLGARLS